MEVNLTKWPLWDLCWLYFTAMFDHLISCHRSWWEIIDASIVIPNFYFDVHLCVKTNSFKSKHLVLFQIFRELTNLLSSCQLWSRAFICNIGLPRQQLETSKRRGIPKLNCSFLFPELTSLSIGMKWIKFEKRSLFALDISGHLCQIAGKWKLYSGCSQIICG